MANYQCTLGEDSFLDKVVQAVRDFCAPDEQPA